jgi:hypothetical protein
MQREGKPSPAYPNAVPALLLAGFFFGSFSTTAKPIPAPRIAIDAASAAMAEAANVAEESVTGQRTGDLHDEG